MRLPVVGLLGLDNQVANAHLLDHGHDSLTGSGANRKHRDHGGYPENHSQHCQKGAQPVKHEILQA